ncbi:hypothetical protein [Spongiactinospora sp. TRM90649]|uniref:hypothetical protein n=1 Tax=Spongiactinospora sp. TRM90649 TaxID=3031114 RepID=UPI0023F94EF9|nr:hypothetical protein [Spongiactinospora sp. TRM90649]MDF5752840.1 hypothetical protein [Spongiactinospora sp. TRM90649]
MKAIVFLSAPAVPALLAASIIAGPAVGTGAAASAPPVPTYTCDRVAVGNPVIGVGDCRPSKGAPRTGDLGPGERVLVGRDPAVRATCHGPGRVETPLSVVLGACHSP